MLKIKKLKKSKKAALGLGLVLALIVGIISLLVMMSFQVGLFAKYKATTRSQICRNTALANAKQGQPMKCPTQFLTLEGKKASGLKRKIADLQVDCFKDYLEGKHDLFVKQEFGFKEEKGYLKMCAVCSVIDFKKKNLVLDKMKNYLQAHYVPKKKMIKYRKIKYYDMFGPNPETTKMVETTSLISEEIDTSERYAIIFSMYKISPKEVSEKLKLLAQIEKKVAETEGDKVDLTWDEEGALSPYLIFRFKDSVMEAIDKVRADLVRQRTTDREIELVKYDTPNLEKLECDVWPVGMAGKDIPAKA